jgi:hypothetical protein
MDVFSESISDVTAGSEQTFDATGGIGVADGVNTGVRKGEGVSVETNSRKLEAGTVGVGLAVLPILQPLNRNIPISNIRNIVFGFMIYSSFLCHYIPVASANKMTLDEGHSP